MGAKFGIMHDLWRDISVVIALGVDRPQNAPNSNYDDQ